MPATDDHRALFPGEYHGSPSGGLSATLSITPTLSYVYEQDLGEASRLDRVSRAGTLRITGPDSASAGRVRLHWATRNTVAVRSPHGSSFDPNPVEGGDYMRGHEFTLRRVGARSESRVLGTVTLAMEPRQAQCEAQVSISYAQLNAQVHVETTVEHDGCAASSGDYELRLRTRNDDGEIETYTFAESWTRSEAEPVYSEKLYDIGDGRRLMWARVSTAQTTNCRCDDAEQSAAAL